MNRATITTLWPDWTYCSKVARKVANNPVIRFRDSNVETIHNLKWHDFWIVPVQNPYGWDVDDIMKAILEVKNWKRKGDRRKIIKVVWWHKLKVNHVLAVLPWQTEEDIGKVFSHPQALLQCTMNLENLNAEQIKTNSTSEKIGTLSPGEAVICSLETARTAGLNIISDQFAPADNATEFVMLTGRRNPW